MTLSRDRTEWQERRAAESALVRGGIRATVKSLHTATMGGSVHPVAPAPKLKREQKVRHSIRDSARGEACLMRLVGVCTGAAIWSHARWPEAGKGGATKAVDVAGAYACPACDAVFDGNAKLPAHLTREEVDGVWMFAHLKSLVILARKGLI